MANIVSAIQSLKPSAEFVLTNDDYSTIVWHELEGEAPTLTQINAEISRLNALEAKAQSDRSEAKAALLDRLGITAEEAALLLS